MTKNSADSEDDASGASSSNTITFKPKKERLEMPLKQLKQNNFQNPNNKVSSQKNGLDKFEDSSKPRKISTQEKRRLLVIFQF